MRKRSYENFVNNVDYKGERVDDYDGIVAVMALLKVTILPIWRQ